MNWHALKRYYSMRFPFEIFNNGHVHFCFRAFLHTTQTVGSENMKKKKKKIVWRCTSVNFNLANTFGAHCPHGVRDINCKSTHQLIDRRVASATVNLTQLCIRYGYNGNIHRHIHAWTCVVRMRCGHVSTWRLFDYIPPPGRRCETRPRKWFKFDARIAPAWCSIKCDFENSM